MGFHFSSQTTFCVMCGISGSGKSTLAKEIKEWVEFPGHRKVMIVSTDQIRKDLYGSEEIQSGGDRVFQTARLLIQSALRNGIDVIFDATNLTRGNRRWALDCAKGFHIDKVLICTDVSVSEALLNQLKRSCRVPEEVIYRQFEKFEFPSKEREKFDRIYISREDGLNEI